ncbi:MAG: response regulator transcription factor [Chitinophagaceae bacterium]
MIKKISIAIVEDFVRFRKGLIMAFEQYREEINILFDAEHGADMIGQINTGKFPDVILMDLQMPVMDGIETTKWLHANHPEIKIIILTTHTDERFIRHMLEIGAHGYLFKNEEPSLIKAAIVEVLDKGYSINLMVEGILKNSLTKTGNSPLLLK